MIRPSRNTRIVIALTAVLLLAAAILAVLNADYVRERRDAQSNATFSVAVDGATHTITMDDILALSPAAVTASYNPSDREAEAREYTGVALADIFTSLDIDASGYSSVTFMAADGYASAISAEDARDASNCYIVFEENGVSLGAKEDGGTGPFMMIMAKDVFSQRWCKFLLEVMLK